MTKILFALTLAVAFVSCTKDEPAVGYLEVNANNISGCWQFESYGDGTTIHPNTAVYFKFIRRDTKYEKYDNLGSHKDNYVKETGVFDIIVDESLGSIIMGYEDFSFKEQWDNQYVVTDLTADRMVWTAITESGRLTDDVRIYRRIASIPATVTGD